MNIKECEYDVAELSVVLYNEKDRVMIYLGRNAIKSNSCGEKVVEGILRLERVMFLSEYDEERV